MARFRCLAVLFALISLILQGQSPGTHPVSGRQIAWVMGMGGADWLVRPEREMEEEPDRALDALRLLEGQTVADIGSGNGYFTWRMAERVGTTGKVYAVDIQPGMLQQLRENLKARRITNVVPVLGQIDDPKLPDSSLDLVLMVDVYHEFSEPQKMLARIRRALKPEGRLVLVEYRKEDPSIPIRPEHKMSEKEVLAEVVPEGFRFEKNIGVLPRQHILIFRPERVQ